MQRRIEVGAIVRRVFQIYFDQAAVLMPAAATVFVFSGLLSILVERSGTGVRYLALLIGLIAGCLFSGMVSELVADVRDGRRDATSGQLVRSVLPVLGQVIVLAIVIGVCVGVGLFLILIPGLILITIWSVAIPALVLERIPGLGALGRSRELVRGNGWQVFGVLLVLEVLVGLVTLLLSGAAESAGLGLAIVVSVAISVLTAPIPALASAVMYFELGGSGSPRS